MFIDISLIFQRKRLINSPALILQASKPNVNNGFSFPFSF